MHHFIRITLTEVTSINLCAAYSTASDAMLVPLSQETEVTSVTGALPIERSLHVGLWERYPITPCYEQKHNDLLYEPSLEALI